MQQHMRYNSDLFDGGIPFSVTLPKAPDSINADLMTNEELHAKLQKGYDDMQAGRVQDAACRGNISRHACHHPDPNQPVSLCHV